MVLGAAKEAKHPGSTPSPGVGTPFIIDVVLWYEYAYS